MPFSLNLPYPLCYAFTRFLRRLRPQKLVKEQHDQGAYFEYQYRETLDRYKKHMRDVPLSGMTVLDVGSGLGGRSLGWLDLGATKVINIDINRQELREGRELVDTKFPDRSAQIEFRHPEEITGQIGEVAILFDCFEHLVDPAPVLERLHGWLRPNSMVWIGSIGWYNYMASHCVGSHIPIPWCQVIFSERAIIRTIRNLLHSPNYVPNVWERLEGLDRWDNVTTLRDRPGEPMNMLSLYKIRRILDQSPFDLREFRVEGFGGKSNPMARLASPLAKVPILQELMHSYYIAILIKKN